jgi:hypothetical protein
MDFHLFLSQHSFAMNSRVASVDSDEEYSCYFIYYDKNGSLGLKYEEHLS